MTHKKHHRPDPRYPLRGPEALPEVRQHHRTRWEQRRAHETIPPEIAEDVLDPQELQHQIQVRAYHKFRERLRMGLPEDRIADWVEAEQEVLALWMKHHAHPHAP